MKPRHLLLVAAGAGAGLLLPAAARVATPGGTDTYQELGQLMNVFQTVRANYVDKVDDKTLIEGAINGMLASLDPHSGYLAKEDYSQIRNLTDGEYGGLGMSVTTEEGAVKVIAPTDDTPAARAGIKAGDFITHLDGEYIVGLSLNDAVDRMRGAAGSKVQVRIVRQGVAKPLEFTLVREKIKIRPVKSEIKGNVGVIRISSFSKNTGADTVAALKDIRAKLGDRLAGIVVDLRSNPGGVLDEAVDVSSAFMTRGEVVSQRGRDPKDVRSFSAPQRPADDIGGAPVVVLIDQGSASAAEIVAGALQDHRRALVLGERSFGKGSVQSVIPLTDATGLRLTVARYFTPSGRSVQSNGIDPDIVVPQMSDPDRAEREKFRLRESDLRRHLVNEVKLDEATLEVDDKTDPRFAVTADELKKAGIKDFQLDYALKTLERLRAPAPTAVAAR